MSNKQLNPAAVAAILVIVIALVGVIGFQYLSRPPRDRMADAVIKERGGATAPAPPGGPMGGAPPPRAGSSDYASPTGSTPNIR